MAKPPGLGFQFHAGSIKARMLARKLIRLLQFQFHAGSIKACISPMNIVCVSRFNSTLVRLRPEVLLVTVERICEFQFHAGSIKATFQEFVQKQGEKVSIPRWFD